MDRLNTIHPMKSTIKSQCFLVSWFVLFHRSSLVSSLVERSKVMETSANRFVSENGVRYLDPLSTQKNMWPYSYIILYILGLILYSLFYGYLEGLSTNQ